jgi:hypothetical protein
VPSPVAVGVIGVESMSTTKLKHAGSGSSVITEASSTSRWSVPPTAVPMGCTTTSFAAAASSASPSKAVKTPV